MELNDRAYWNHRFSTDWMDYGGNEQTQVFARMLIGHLPTRLVEKIQAERLRIVDVGCAQGECVAMLKERFPESEVVGVDFSDKAIEIARKQFPNCQFRVQAGDRLSDKFDVVVCSNVLEHIEQPKAFCESLFASAVRYLVVLVPFREPADSGIKEHVNRFTLDDFAMSYSNFRLECVRVIAPEKGHESFWPYHQLLLVYEKCQEDSPASGVGDILSAVAAVADLQLDVLQMAERARTEIHLSSERLDAVKAAMSDAEAILRDELAEARSSLAVREEECRSLRADLSAKEDECKCYAEEKFKLGNENESLKSRVCALQETVARHKMAEDAVMRFIRGFVGNNTARMANVLKRIQFQVLHGGLQGKRDFLGWLRAARARRNSPDARFNPFWDIHETVRRTFEVCRQPAASPDATGESVAVQAERPRFVEYDPLDEYCRYDVLFFSVIDYDFRYQRPQQIADDYARKGHRVFYFNANFGVGTEPTVVQKKENLYVVTLNFAEPRNVHTFTFDAVRDELETQLGGLLESRAVLDALAIAEYPNWIDAVRYVKHRHAFADVLDYLDDYDGFENTASVELKENTKAILMEADQVVASSLYLQDKARRFGARVSLVRNGTEYAHFHQACCNRKLSHRRKVGYYGAIAHWFDFGKIKALAKALPDVDIELIGHVSENVDELKAFKNVSFLGEKAYGELPGYLREWDVCLIPFDTSTSLIQATNPVKFYEYLSAGKKVVATEIPEISEFRDRYVCLANKDDDFVEHVKRCLEGTDGLASPEECMRFAAQNDWHQRVNAFSDAVESSAPMFSIIVLTYNQLEYTKLCLNSILQWSAYPNYEVIVVDNASSDGTPDYLRKMASEHKRIRIVLNEKNLGFAAGNNVGLREAKGDYLILLNNDVIISRGWLSRFLAQFRGNERVGAVGPVTNSIWDASMVPALYESVSEMQRFATARSFDHAFKSREAENLAMFCFAISREVYVKIGPVSEDYGRGMFEDDDYCAALAAAGLRLIGAEDVFIHHFLSASFNKMDSEEMLKLHAHNREIFEKKWHRKWALHPFREGVDGSTNQPLVALYPKIKESGVNLGYYACKRFEISEADVGAFIRSKRSSVDYKGVYVIPSVWWNVPIFQRSQQMALAFRKAGFLVVYIEKPDGDSYPGLVRNILPGLYVVTASDFDRALSDVSDCIVSLYSTAFEICSEKSETLTEAFMRRNQVVYEYIDHFDEKITGKMTAQICGFYKKLVKSDWPVNFLASARCLQRDLAHDSGKPVIYVPNGVDAEHYSQENIRKISQRVVLPECLLNDRVKIGYFGAMAPWLDYEVLSDVIAKHPGWDFIFLGPDFSGGASKLPQAVNCHWLGPVAYADLPYYASKFDVAILPFVKGDLAKATSPLKLFEYFALGKPVVVTSDMAECTVYSEVFSGDGTNDFDNALVKAVSVRSDLEFQRKIKALAEANTWVARAQSLRDALN